MPTRVLTRRDIETRARVSLQRQLTDGRLCRSDRSIKGDFRRSQLTGRTLSVSSDLSVWVLRINRRCRRCHRSCWAPKCFLSCPNPVSHLLSQYQTLIKLSNTRCVQTGSSPPWCLRCWNLGRIFLKIWYEKVFMKAIESRDELNCNWNPTFWQRFDGAFKAPARKMLLSFLHFVQDSLFKRQICRYDPCQLPPKTSFLSCLLPRDIMKQWKRDNKRRDTINWSLD